MPYLGRLINNKPVFLAVLVVGKSKIKTLEDAVSEERPLSGS